MENWKPKKGDSVFYADEKGFNIGETTVVSAGNNWVKTKNGDKYDSELLQSEVGGYRLYQSKEAWLNETRRHNKWLNNLRKLESMRNNISLEQLLRIEEILDENAKN